MDNRRIAHGDKIETVNQLMTLYRRQVAYQDQDGLVCVKYNGLYLWHRWNDLDQCYRPSGSTRALGKDVTHIRA